MTKTFKIGDIVEANEASNHLYYYTTQGCGWRGKVVKVVGGTFDATAIEGRGSAVGELYRGLSPKYFDLVTSDTAKQSIEIIEGLTVELTAEQLEEVSRKLQSAADNAKKGTPLAPRRATVGDVVVIVSNEASSVNKVGDIGKIVIDDHSSMPYRVEAPGRGFSANWEYERCVRLATAEEIAKYEEALKPKLKVGDWVRNIKDEDSDLTIGKVYKVNDIALDGFVGVTDDLGDENGIASEDYEIIDKLTPFDRAGRKPGGYKIGDIVRVVNCVDEHKTGDLRIIHSTEAYAYDYGLSNPNNEGERLGLIDAKHIELVTPVESRVDIAEGGERA